MRMDIKIEWLLLVLLTNLAWCYRQCPVDCKCPLDDHGRIQTICGKGGMNTIPIRHIDSRVEVLIIRGPRNALTIGPIFSEFKNLEILQITDSNVPSVGVHSFWGITSLRSLDLSRNNITTLLNSNFRGQNKLRELDLSHNKIGGLTSWVFHYLTDLQRLNLADNTIDELVPRVFYMLNKLKYLDLSGNPLINLSFDVFKDIMDLKELKCRNCNLWKIDPHIFHHVSSLTELDVGDNNFKYLDNNEFVELRRLLKLRLDGNQLTVITDNLFSAQKSLECLDLSRNRLASITNGAFENLLNLTHLDLSYNKLMKLEAATMAPLKKLQSFNISGNIHMNLSENEAALQLLHRLKTFFAADMSTIPMDLLQPFHNLKSVNLSGNVLTNASLAILNDISNLELLDLSRNQLEGFDDTHVLKLQKIKDVKLENNPLICDRCHMGTLIDIARRLSWNIYPICFLPEPLRGAPISDLHTNTLAQCIEFIADERHDAASTSINVLLTRANLNLLVIACGIVFISVVVVFLVGLVGCTRHSAKYYTHEEKRNEGGFYEKSPDALSIAGTELNFKFPIDDVVYTVDDIIISAPGHIQATTQTHLVPPTFTSFSRIG